MTKALLASDLAQLEAHGICEDEALRQLALFDDPPPPAAIVRACTLGDGIRKLPPASEFEANYSRAVQMGRVTKFVPASGAASRMFQALAEARASNDPAETEAFKKLTNSLQHFPFAERLEGADQWSARALLDAILDFPGLGLAHSPKGLVPFHRRRQGAARTAFEEHLIEAALVLGNAPRTTDSGTPGTAKSICSVHFTISKEHQSSFEETLAYCREEIEAEHGVKLDVSFSTQSFSTDTLAVDAQGNPFRTEADQLLLRPGGHGSLIGNLNALARAGADVVTIKNIDNILPAHRQEEANQVKRALIGVLTALEETTHSLLASLTASCEPQVLDQAYHFLEHELGRTPGIASNSPDPTTAREELIRQLDRPLRVCGMVPNLGEPGGGPFWVEDSERGEAPQIVESSQIDTNNPAHARVLAAATHFNPVELVCAVRDWQGNSFDLERFVDHSSWFLAEKSQGGRTLRALERPGLWNGAMGGWNTVFVEVPASTFAPVKTVFDLLRPEHS